MAVQQQELPGKLPAAWSGTDVAEVVETYAEVVTTLARERHEANLREAEGLVRDAETRLRYLAQQMQTRQAELAERRAILRGLRSEELVIPPEELADQIETIRSLPGVLGIKIVDDRLVVHFRTATLYRNRLYDLGDFEIMVGRTTHGRAYSLRCTRSGLKRRPCDSWCKDCTGHYESGLYWSPSSYSETSGGLGTGSFCFGSRSNQIAMLFQEGRIAEMVHLVIATMCTVNHYDQRRIPDKFEVIKIKRRERRRIEATGVMFQPRPI